MLHLLTPDAQTIATLCKRLRMRKPELEAVIAQNRVALEAQGMVLHVATASEVARAIKLPSLSNADEPTYYSKLSRSNHA